ncbi:sesquipedalian [Anaeramoeba flamelloides]|uniref:Sesquipedalian n=1 Tax=Anaeramoeba flamelloides TaxID=1746091 RepID=A0AAV7Z0M2_9EUKA|nr:sesquipedalian [Anaeramoeba flamelloides]
MSQEQEKSLEKEKKQEENEENEENEEKEEKSTKEEVLVEGFVHKQNSREKQIKKKNGKQWKKRYFKLFPDRLQYSIKEDSKILGSMNLYKYQCFPKEEVTDRFILRLFKPTEKSLFLEFENEDTMDIWKNHFKTAITNCSKKAFLENQEETKKHCIAYLKTGWLFKQGVKGLFKKKWKRRFFVLKSKDLTLNYFATEKYEGQPKGKILLSDVKSVGKAIFNDEPFGLTVGIFSTKRIYKIAADSAKERDSWIVIIQDNSENLEK